MRERLKNALISLLIALTIWLFAESQSLGEASDTARIVFAEEAGGGTLLTARGWEGQVALDLRGSKTAIARARALLDAAPVELHPGMAGVPASEGSYSIDLLTVLGAYEPLVRAGVTVTSVIPPRVEVIAREMVTHDLPIAAKIEGIEVEGPVRITPERAAVRLPRSLWEQHGEALRLEAAPSAEDRARLRQGGQATLLASLALPPELQGEPGVRLSHPTVLLSFTVRSTIATMKIDLVPVWVVMPPTEARNPELAVDVAQADQLLSIEVSGPRDALERLRASNDRLIALLSLTSDEIDAGITSKAVGFALLREGVMSPLPEGVRVSSPKAAIGVSIRRASP